MTPSNPRHTPEQQPFEVILRYPHHPHAGEQGVLWLPGVMAGAAFGLLYMLIWRLREAVVAHSTWNALTAAVVLAGSQWQLW